MKERAKIVKKNAKIRYAKIWQDTLLHLGITQKPIFKT